ncbi:MAG: phage tail assembly protein [Armatimonadota bacterium]
MPKDITTDTENTSENTFAFSEPVPFEGNTVESIVLDFSRVKGKDIARCSMRARQAMTAQGEMPFAIETEPTFLMLIASTAANHPVELFDALPGPDYMRLMTTVRGFLFSGQ